MSPASRRPRRGEAGPKSPIPEIYEDELARQIDAEAFGVAMQRLEAFAQNRFGPLIPRLGAAFFKGASRDEVRDPALQRAFRMWLVLGFRDEEGLRIVDMFAAAGLLAAADGDPARRREIERAVNGARRSQFTIARVTGRAEQSQQLTLSDILRDRELTFLDSGVFARAEVGDHLAAWFFPSGALWRAAGLCTRIPARVGDLRSAVSELGRHADMQLPDLAQRRSMPLFWLAYRSALQAPDDA